MPLTPTDRIILSAWSKQWRFPGARDSRIAELTGLSPTQQHQRLVVLADLSAAMEAYPITTRRLRSIRAQRQRSRRVSMKFVVMPLDGVLNTCQD